MPPMDIAHLEEENIIEQQQCMLQQHAQKRKQARKKVKLYYYCRILIMNIKEKKHDWTKNGIKAKRKSIETLCELLNVKQKLGSNNSIYNASFMNDSRMNNEN